MGEFPFDVFLSHSDGDRLSVETLAERLRSDGLRVWFSGWEILPGERVSRKIEEGLESSRALILCVSKNALGNDWPLLEAETLRFRDPINADRRFIPLRLDDAPLSESLNQFYYLSWLPKDREEEYPKLLRACQPPNPLPAARDRPDEKHQPEHIVQLDRHIEFSSYDFDRERKRLLAGSPDTTVRSFDVESGKCVQTFGNQFVGHRNTVRSVAWSPDERYALSASGDGTLRVWKPADPEIPLVLESPSSRLASAAWSPDGKSAVGGAEDGRIHIWNFVHVLKIDEKTRGIRPAFGEDQTLRGHASDVLSLTWRVSTPFLISGSVDRTVRFWNVDEGRCLRVFEGHTEGITSVACTSDGRYFCSGSRDSTVRVWDLVQGICVQLLEGRSIPITCLALTQQSRYVATGAADGSVQVWDLESEVCTHTFGGDGSAVASVAWSEGERQLYAATTNGSVRVWDVGERAASDSDVTDLASTRQIAADQVQYTNAKVLLVGETSAGKTGLSMRLALDDWRPSESTLGAWATQWKLPLSDDQGVEREIWLWDFGGQADQRLIHQLYMEETALAVLVFDGQKHDVFETLGQWDRDLGRASTKPFAKLLAAGRTDVGGLRVSRSQLDAFVAERGFAGCFETSAKTGAGCDELKRAIVSGIQWGEIPWRSSPALFKQLKEAILRLKDEGHVLLRFNELRAALQVRLSADEVPFTDAQLQSVVRLLAGPGLVWELSFGSWVLLQPERLNVYAQAVIQTLRSDEYEHGSVLEASVLNGELDYQAPEQRLASEEERFVLLAMHQTLVERGLCMREHSEDGPLLIFPSYHRRERPELEGHPAVLVTYQFTGFLDDIYATLVVRLHHLKAFITQDELWRYAADFKTLTGKKLGVKLSRRAEGAGQLDIYFANGISVEEKIIFIRYIHEHLMRKAQDVVRLRRYVCAECSTIVGNQDVAMRRLDDWLGIHATETAADVPASRQTKPPTIICAQCEKRVPLWDALEQHFASPEMSERVEEMLQESTLILDNESKERALVGEVISTVALAGQICREFNVSDHGIDMEIEFKDDAGKATGERLYLQLKSGDSYLRQRARDGVEVFRIREPRHAEYWMAQKFPVLLVTRSSDGVVRWMEVRDVLKGQAARGEALTQLLFDGERFDVMSVRKWRTSALTAV